MLNHHIISFLLFFAFYFAPLPATSSSNGTDLRALLAIKVAIVSDPLGTLSSWNESIHFCGWKGVFCSKKHPSRVVAINLMSQGLSGSLSPYVGNMSFLSRIVLTNNSFHGQLPEAVGRLRHLLSLNLSYNSFTGTIPQELGSLYKLKYLDLRRNQLYGTIPPSIGNLTALEMLSFAECALEREIPESIGRLQSLTYLSLAVNRLSGGVPSGLYNISALSSLDLLFNQLEGVIPQDIGFTLPNLEFLGLGGNKFTGILPASLSNASLIWYIDLSHNDFLGPMLMDLGRLSRLQWLSLYDNHIQADISFVSSLTNCTNLKVLDLSNSLMISGSLPDSIANLSSQLSWINLADNQIHGNIPSGIEYLRSLTFLNINNNDFDGPIPFGIGKLSNLKKMFMGGNRFTNELPPSIGNLTQLSILSLEENNICGSIPPALGNLTMLLGLALFYNNFSGSIPYGVMKISSISILLDLSHNALTGPIPWEVSSMTQLAELDLSNNRLSGSVPDSLSSCTSLERLYLQGNSLEGEVPHGLDGLKALKDLDLSRNNFFGSIPFFLSELHLEKLNLSFNWLHGEVPTVGIFTNKAAVSLYGNNDLCGGIPELNLPPCQENSTNNNRSAILKILIPTALCGITFVALSLHFHMRVKMSKNNTCSAESLKSGFLRLSYGDILKATYGFAEGNMVGAGRFGSVYKGILEDGLTLVAVKVLNLHVTGASKSFVAECNALRGIRHRNVLKLLNVCSSMDFGGNDFKALVYEYQSNGSLDKWLHQEREQDSIQDEQVRCLTVIQRLNIAIDIASGIEYLHSGTGSVFVHGDLKPSNILLDDDMTASIGDFGLTKIISDLPPAHSNSSIGICGTIGYIPPEYGTSCLVTTQGDVYSFGIILLEMFTNKRPSDDAFVDYFNLQKFDAQALPGNIMKIVDPLIMEMEHDMNSRIKDILESILSIGVTCSNELARDRMSMADVVTQLQKIKNAYLSCRISVPT